MNFFTKLREVAGELVQEFADGERWEVDLAGAKIQLHPRGGHVDPLTGQVVPPEIYGWIDYLLMTPGGEAKQVMATFQQRGDHVLVVLPGKVTSFSLTPFREKWQAPREKGVAEVASEAIYANWKKHGITPRPRTCDCDCTVTCPECE